MQHDAERINIIPLIHPRRAAFQHFRRHVVGRAEHLVALRHAWQMAEFRQAEINDARLTVMCWNKNIGRLEIAVFDAGVMEGLNAAQYFEEQRFFLRP